MPRLRPRSVVLLLLAAALTGCGAGPAEPPDPFPPRPVAIDIDRLDPCALLTPEDQEVLKVGGGKPDVAELRGVPTRACGWGSLDTPFEYSTQLIPQDAAQAVGAQGTVVGSVRGYGTVRITEQVDTYPLCEILIDADEGELVRVQVQTVEKKRDTGEPYPVEETCSEADRFSDRVLRNALRPAP